jgi:PAS domain-containing protein
MAGEALESTAPAAFPIDREGPVADRNDAARGLLGYERKEVGRAGSGDW